MRIQLKRTSAKQEEFNPQFKVERLLTEGTELEVLLGDYLSRFTEGIMDPDIRGMKPDGFIQNLQKGKLGDFSKRYILTAYEEERVIGILIGLPEGEQGLHIYSLHISPEYRGMGGGSSLLSRCLDDMYKNGVKDILIDVHKENKPAYNLYKKFGFNA